MATKRSGGVKKVSGKALAGKAGKSGKTAKKGIKADAKMGYKIGKGFGLYAFEIRVIYRKDENNPKAGTLRTRFAVGMESDDRAAAMRTAKAMVKQWKLCKPKIKARLAGLIKA